MKKKPFSDLVIGLSAVALGIVVLLLSGKLQTVKLGIGPAGFPRFIAALLIILGAVMAVPALLRGVEKPRVQVEKKAASLFLAAIAMSLVYVCLVSRVGFLIMTPLLLFGMMWLFGERKLPLMIAVSLITTIVIWLLFTKVFHIFLPSCRLF